MLYRLIADLILVLHLAFAAFALFGGLLVLRRPHAAWLHLPALAWGVFVQWADCICPLTPLENYFRVQGGEAGYEGGFIEHYLSMLLYPDNLTIELRYLLGAVLLTVNAVVYVRLIFRKRA
jgi:hypothetical protein